MDHNTSRGATGAAPGLVRARARPGAPREDVRAATNAQRGRRAASGNGNSSGVAVGTATPTATAGEMQQEAKTISDEMRALFKTLPPWSREVEAVRQECRNIHLAIIFTHPFSPHAHSLDPTWIQTSYLPIAAFREHVARADAAVVSSGSGPGGARSAPRTPASTSASGPSQELKKVLTRFRQFLASEEAWYRHLLQRLDRFFALRSLVRGPLEQVGLGAPRNADAAGQREAQVEGLRIEDKRDKLALVHKALICLGDIERYREQYSDAVRRGDGSKENYARARGYYEAARSVLPDDGSAYNQLAVICTYLPDEFSAVYYYFRSLAVRVAFRGADEILERYLRKAYERWEARGGLSGGSGRRAREAVTSGRPSGPGDVELDADGLKSELIVLISIIQRQHSPGFDSIALLKAGLLPSLSRLLLARALPSEVIVKLSSIVIGAHWSARNASSLLGAPPSPGVAASAGKEGDYARAHRAEDEALALLLGVFGVLLSAGASEVEGVLMKMQETGESAVLDEDEEDGVDDGMALRKRITPALRRMLPSLRLLSKWLKLHLDYLSRFMPTSVEEEGAAPVVEVFWGAYYRFIEALARAFPLGQLPSCASGMSAAGADLSGAGAGNGEEALEEDEDMRGYLPVERGFAIYRDRGKSAGSGSGSGGAEDVAPNDESKRPGRTPDEEGLMRVADLEVDATLVLQAQTQTQTQMDVDASEGVDAQSDEVWVYEPGANGQKAMYRDSERRLEEMDDADDGDVASVSTNTEDDPVNLAMRATLGSESEGGSEMELGSGMAKEAGHVYGADVWGTPAFDARATAGGQASQYDPGRAGTSPHQPRPVPPAGSGTAYDLLAGLMLNPPPPGAGGIGAPSSGSLPTSGLRPGSDQGQFGTLQSTTSHPVSPHGAAYEFGTPPGSRVGAAGTPLAPSAGTAPPPLAGDGVWAMTREESHSQKGRMRGAGAGTPGQAAWGTAMDTLRGPGYPETPRGADRSQEGFPRDGGQGLGAVGHGRVRDIWAGGAGEMRTPLAGSAGPLPSVPAQYGAWYGPSHAAPSGSAPGPTNQAQGYGMVPPPMGGPVASGMDAAQLFAGISGQGGSSAAPWGTPGPRQDGRVGWSGQTAPAPADAPARFGSGSGHAMGDAGRWR